ncbi:hypothetical protein l13_02720 [Neisseria weaveri ATCC 51223]|nr:hypothetical protein l13_02720 [Neisseria weaveri ATCC 51223]
MKIIGINNSPLAGLLLPQTTNKPFVMTVSRLSGFSNLIDHFV